MSAKLFTLIATLAVIAHWSQVNACKCRVLPDPGYCRTGFVGLIKITGQYLQQQSYYFVVKHMFSSTRRNRNWGEQALLLWGVVRPVVRQVCPQTAAVQCHWDEQGLCRLRCLPREGQNLPVRRTLWWGDPPAKTVLLQCLLATLGLDWRKVHCPTGAN